MVAAYQTLVAAFMLLAKTGKLNPEPPFRPVAQMTGADTSVEIARISVIQSQSSWVDLWHEHRQSFQLNVPAGAPSADDADRPPVDFKKNVVVCMFGGASQNVSGFELADVGDVKNVAYIRIRPRLLPASTNLQLQQNAYMFLVVPRTRRKMVVQIDQSALVDPSAATGDTWRTLATLPPTTKDN